MPKGVNTLIVGHAALRIAKLWRSPSPLCEHAQERLTSIKFNALAHWKDTHSGLACSSGLFAFPNCTKGVGHQSLDLVSSVPHRRLNARFQQEMDPTDIFLVRVQLLLGVDVIFLL